MVSSIENDLIFLFDPEQILPFQVRVNLGVMAMKGYSTLPHIQNIHQMQLNILPRTSLFCDAGVGALYPFIQLVYSKSHQQGGFSFRWCWHHFNYRIYIVEKKSSQRKGKQRVDNSCICMVEMTESQSSFCLFIKKINQFQIW